MATPTTIRHKLTTEGFAVVTTVIDPGFAVYVQHYGTIPGRQGTYMISELTFTDERPAIAAWEAMT